MMSATRHTGGRAGATAVVLGVAAGVVMAACLPAHALIRVKANNASNLNTTASWVGATVPGNLDVARWTNTVTGGNAVQLGGDMNVQGLSIFNPGGMVEIGGTNSLVLGMNGIEMNAASQHLLLTNAAVTIAAVEQSWRVASGILCYVTPASFVRATGATLNFQGPGAIASDTMTNDPTGIMGPWATFGAGATTMYATVSTGSIVGNAGVAAATVANVNDATGTVNYDLATNGAFGAGVAFNTLRYTGAAGTISNDFSANGLLNSGAGALTLAGNIAVGSNLSLVVTSPDATRAINLPGAITDNAAGPSGFVKAGPGTVTLGGSNSYGGVTFVNRGVLLITNSSALGSTAAATIVAAGPGNTAFGGQLQLRGGITVAEPMTLGGESAVNSFDGALRGSTGTNTVTGLISTVPNGFRVATDAGVQLNIAGGVVGTNVQVVVSGAAGSTIAVTNTPWNLGTGGAFYDDGGSLTTLSATGNVWGSLLKAGGGTLRIDAAGALPSNAIVRIGVSYSTNGTVDLNGFDATIGGLQTGTSGAGDAFAGGVRILTSPGAVTLTVNQAGSLLYDGQITGPISLTKLGAGTMTLSRSNSYSGITIVNSGAVYATHSYALGSPASPTILNSVSNAYIQISGNVNVPEPLTVFGQRPGNASSINVTGGTNVWSGPISIVSQWRLVVSAGAMLTMSGGVNGTNTFFVLNSSGVIAFSNAPVKIGAGQFWTDSPGFTILGTAGNVWGTTLAAKGTLRTDAAFAFPSNSLLQMGVSYGTDGTVDLNGNDQIIGGLQTGNSGEGVIYTNGIRIVTSVAAATLTVNQTTNCLYDGKIAGALSFTKSGTGRLTLLGTNTYSGATVVSNGTLALVNGGSLASPSIGIAAGASLVVTGRVDGALALTASQTLGGRGTLFGNVNNGGIVAPGSSAGQLNIAGNFTQTNGALNIEIGGTSPGVDLDLLSISNSATLGGTLNVSLINGYSPASGDMFPVMLAPAIGGNFAVTNYPPLAAGLGWELQNAGVALVLSVTGTPVATGFDLFASQIPEPSQRGPAADPDGDGYANLLEYATGGNPTNADQTARMNGVRTNGVLALQFTRATNATDATLIVEGGHASTNDATWAGIAVNSNGAWSGSAVVTEGAGNPAAVTVQDTDATATNRFLRLRVTRP